MTVGDLELRAESTSEIRREGSHMEIQVLFDERPTRIDEVLEVCHLERSFGGEASSRGVITSVDRD